MPRIKSEMRSAGIAYSMYILTAQKKEIKDSVLYYPGMFAVLVGMLIMWVVIAYTQEWTDFSYVVTFIAVPFLSIAGGVCAFKFIRNFSILRSLNRIRSESAETVKIECKDVRFITHNSSSRLALTLILAIIFVGTNHKKYLYVLPEHLFYNKKTREHLIDKCLFETVELMCYKGTRMLKYFDVKFFDIRDRYR